MQPQAIVNTHAGGGRAREYLPALESAGFTLHQARDAAHAEQLAAAAAAAGAPTLACAGGDGTIRSVVSGARRAQHERRCSDLPELLILPAGTGNDCARALGLPLDPAAAVGLVTRSAVRAIDLIRAQSPTAPIHWVVNLANGGLAGHVAQRLEKDDKARLGPLAYLKALAGVATDMPRFNLTLTSHADTRRFPDAAAAMIANGPTAGGGWTLVPDARPDDGLLNILVVTDATAWDRLRAMARTLVAAHPEDPIVETWTATTVTVESDPPLPFSSDGDAVGTTPLTFTIEPAALRVRVPDQAGAK